MNKPASELIARLEVSQRACFDAGLHVAAMDIQSARAEIARTAANQSGSERAGVDALQEALTNLLDYAEQNECSHETTHRGGSIWTICNECGKKWADDRGGFIPYQEPKEITQARAALHSPKIAAAEISPGDVLSALDLLQLEQRGRAQAFRLLDQARSVSDPAALAKADAYEECGNELKAAIDRLDVKAVAIKPLEWIATKEANRSEYHGSKPFSVEYTSVNAPMQYVLSMNWKTGGSWDVRGDRFRPIKGGTCVSLQAAKAAAQADFEQRIRSALTHPTTKPEAPAVSVDAIKRDAERYRLIRDRNSPLEAHANDEHLSAYHIVGGVRELKWGDNLDRAIDAALIAGGR